MGGAIIIRILGLLWGFFTLRDEIGQEKTRFVLDLITCQRKPITPDFHRLTKQLSGFLGDVIISFLNLPLFWYVWPL